MRVQGRTAYIGDQNTGIGYSLLTQGLSLTALVLSPTWKTNAFVEKLANFVAQGNANTAGYGYWCGHRDAAVAAWSLSEYDEVKGNTDPKLGLRVLSGKHILLTGTFTQPTDPVLHSSTSWSAITPRRSDRPDPLEFYAKGQGEVSVAAGLDFVPLNLSPDPVYRGIYVEKSIRRLSPDGSVVVIYN
jgi:hypothetical protein